MTAGDKRRQGK